MQKFVICIEDTGEQYACADSRSVLEGMEALGKKGKGGGEDNDSDSEKGTSMRQT